MDKAPRTIASLCIVTQAHQDLEKKLGLSHIVDSTQNFQDKNIK